MSKEKSDSLIDMFTKLGKDAGANGSITVTVECEDGLKNRISWKGNLATREPMMVRALRVLHDGIVMKRKNDTEDK